MSIHGIVNDPGQPGTKIAVTKQDLADTRCYLAGHDHPETSACADCDEWGESAWFALMARYTFAVPQKGEA